jgi:hypothetical protein
MKTNMTNVGGAFIQSVPGGCMAAEIDRRRSSGASRHCGAAQTCDQPGAPVAVAHEFAK